MHDVDVMCTLLEEQAVGIFLFGVPVAEISIAAVVDEVTAPAALDFTDHTGVDNFFHLEDDGEVAHIVTDEEFGTGFHRSFQDTVATFNGDCHGLFKVDGFPGFESGNSHFFVTIVRSGNKDSINVFNLEYIAIVCENLCVGELFFERSIGFC